MMKHAVQPSTQAPSLLLPYRYGTLQAIPVSRPSSSSLRRHQVSRGRNGRIHCSVSEESSSLATVAKEKHKQPATVKAVVTVKQTVGGRLAHLGADGALDAIEDMLGKTILLELVSTELDPKTGREKQTVQAFAHKADSKGLDVNYEATFTVPKDFGEIGAILVTNEHHKEMYLLEVILMTGNVCFLPSETPEGLQRLRETELETLRGDGTGERKFHERIYDYATYNDLGDPDKDEETARPVLGGNNQFPYPRRCRTGRPRTKKDPHSEIRKGDFYVPRDETFSEIKQATFSAKTVRSLLKALVPSIQTSIIDKNLGFPYFTAIDTLFSQGVPLPPQDGMSLFRTVIPRLVKEIEEKAEDVLLFERPAMIDRDGFSWFRDEEFTRQTLAGLNPLSIELIREFPLVSKLDPKIYGPPESEITRELIEKEIKGVMTVEQALTENRLFILDYHDLFLPYVHKVRELEGSTLYGSRTVFFLTPSDTLRPIAIELTRPATPTKPQWKKAFSPSWDATGAWLWKLAKVHVLAHDSGYHQLVSHWLRTHACTEPYIIAANRQLSAMHPIYRLLHPHFRYTMEINALARESLINAGGVIETTFAPGKYSIELSAVAYGKLWQFDTEALPADLIRRGMATPDPTAEHGLTLTVKDYPYANDGLLIWSNIKQWVSDYVSHYYPDAAAVAGDGELQAFWSDVITKGHADKKDEKWWPKLDSAENLTHVLTTVIWVVSGHHAAVNFGQYHYAGYFPNRPTTARTNMPVEDEGSVDFATFLNKPESTLLECYPSQVQATVVMSVLDVLSTHAPDEEYLGRDAEPAWRDEPVIHAAFERFSGRMKEIEGIIDARNLDPELRNRCGAGIVPYELLKPYSESGVTGKGVPNSISI